MTSARVLFPGAMGPEGFISCFDHLIPERQLRRKLILKGGPGVGKSTFMRRMHASLCEGGTPSTLYFCSGDPDSLDAIAIPNLGLLVLDGTAPHSIDPQIPGARDSIINLGSCLDEATMRPRLPHIRACMTDHAAATARARAALSASWALKKDSAAVFLGILKSSLRTSFFPSTTGVRNRTVHSRRNAAVTEEGAWEYFTKIEDMAMPMTPTTIMIIGCFSMYFTNITGCIVAQISPVYKTQNSTHKRGCCLIYAGSG